MLTAAGIMSISDFQKIGDSVDVVLKNNYQSIESAKKILDALEREDSGILLWLLDDEESGKWIIYQSDSTIRKSIIDLRNNITEIDEEDYISAIADEYESYAASLQKVLSDSIPTEVSKDIYDNETDSLFQRTKTAIDNLMLLNNKQMYRQAGIVKEQSRRAMMPAIVSITGAVLFAILLCFFIWIYFIAPVRQLIKSVNEYYPEQGSFNAGIVSKDEFKQLESAINQLIFRLKRKNKSNQ